MKGEIVATMLLFAFTGQLSPVLVVAKRGAVGDWAAYCAGITIWDGDDHEPESSIARHVAEHGYKLEEAQARAFFPKVKGDYRP